MTRKKNPPGVLEECIAYCEKKGKKSRRYRTIASYLREAKAIHDVHWKEVWVRVQDLAEPKGLKRRAMTRRVKAGK